MDTPTREVDAGVKLSAEAERAALSDPHFADAFLDGDAFALRLRGYIDSRCVPGIEWLFDVHIAVKANAVEIAQKLLRDDGEGALDTWNASANANAGVPRTPRPRPPDEIARSFTRIGVASAPFLRVAIDEFWPARAMTKMADGAWKIVGTRGQELTIYPDRLREFLLDLQRFLVNAGTRGAAMLQ